MQPGRGYIGVSAGAVVYDDAGHIFLDQRGPAARDDVGKWEFPGGKVLFNEAREDAIKRIMSEKYGMEVEVAGLLGVYDVIDPELQDHWVSTTYVCRHCGGEPRICFSDKCIAVGWFDLTEVSTLDLSRISRLNLSDLLDSDDLRHGAKESGLTSGITLERLTRLVMDQAKAKGFGTAPEEIEVSEKIALIHSEVTEAYQAYRHKNMEGKDGFNEELGDVIQRVLHLCGVMDIDVAQEILKKLEANRSRVWNWDDLRDKHA